MRIVHFCQRIKRGLIIFPKKKRNFGFKIALISFIDSLFPPEKSERYIKTVEKFVDNFTKKLVYEFQNEDLENVITAKNENTKCNLWCCWWQGEDSMPEIVKMCNQQLKKVISNQNIQYHMITLDNYKEYVTIPKDIIMKFESNKITMTEMSDILRVNLLYEYGGIWLDSTVFLTKQIDEKFLFSTFYSQRMYDPVKWQHEACKGRWCGFIVSGKRHNPMFKYLNDCFIEWWRKYDCVIDYVIYDYFLLSLYKNNSLVKSIIDNMKDNNVEVFEMYKHLNDSYSIELWEFLNKNTSMHKLTYKMDLYKEVDNNLTLYGHLLKEIQGDKYAG